MKFILSVLCLLLTSIAEGAYVVQECNFNNLYYKDDPQQTPRTPDEQCEFVIDYCSGAEVGSPLNSIHLYYCKYNQWFGDYKLVVFVPTILIFLALFIYLLQTTAEEYMTPSVEAIVDFYKLNESLAAVTVLAFGGGSVEVFSALGNSDKSFAIGDTNVNGPLSSLLGGYLFTSTIGIAASLYAA